MKLTKFEALLAFLLVICMVGMIWMYDNIQDQNRKIAELIMPEEMEINIPIDSMATCEAISLADSIMLYLIECKVQHPDIAFAQIMLETGWLKSKLYQRGNNLFGMKYPKKRPTTATSIVYGHAGYTSWKVSIHDYMLWQSYFARNLTKDEYFDVLSKRYAIDPDYVDKVKLVMRNKGG